MFDAWTSFDLLTLFVIGIGASSLGLWEVLVRATAPDRKRPWARACGPLIPATLFATVVGLGRQPGGWLLPLALAGVYGACQVLRSPVAGQFGNWILARAASVRLQGTILAAFGVTVVGWCVHQANSELTPMRAPDHGPAAQLMAAMHEDPWATAATDRGRRVRLFTFPENSVPDAGFTAQETELIQQWGPSLQLIRTGPADGRADCHGWTFAGGRWWIQGQDVPRIVEDNGYQPVSRPQAGDLVVYQDLSGTITHTGVVFAVGERQEVLIESKWCWLGRYLHAPEAQPYGPQFVYYRSPRGSHGLHIRDLRLSPGTNASDGAAELSDRGAGLTGE